jgi:sulfate transport system ATP-binding protein
MSIEIHNITKTFGRYTALRDVSFTVPDGELVALLGPSGSGKTTLLRIIAGLEVPDDAGGVIRFNGEDVTGRSVGRRAVGFVFQHYALFRHMTVFENIAFGLRVRPRALRPPRSQIRDKVEELLRLIQLEGIENRYPSQLSGGQRQRVALARVLAIEPKVLLLDEPFGALDAKVRQSLRRWLRKLHDEIHVTSVFVTHDQEEALELADRIVVMNKGRIEQVGAPDEVFHRSANAFVMDFLGSVNLFHGRIENGKAVFEALALDQPGGRPGGSRRAKFFVRPHDLEVETRSNGKSSIRAQVSRILSAGPLVKIELTTETGEPANAEMSHEEFAAKQIGVGRQVFISPRDARVFTEDYSI